VFSLSDHTQVSPQMNQYLNDHKKKKAVIITARVHPGEANSSYIMEGIIKFLTSNHREAKILR
jgi:cytosolic carboxypeptidase protein 2/3